MSETIDPLPRLGLLNIMPSPAYVKTEHQWRDALLGQAEIVQIRFDEDPRVDSRLDIGEFSHRLSDVASNLDGLIVTGANLEVHPNRQELFYSEITYHDQLNEIIDWSTDEKRLTVFSCLASHIALSSLFGIDRTIQANKTFGVYEHELQAGSWLSDNTGKTKVKSPHSRWGDVASKQLDDAGIDVLCESEEAGWLVSSYDNYGRMILFLQGHPEYQRDDLKKEWLRDATTGQELPVNYFQGLDGSSKDIEELARLATSLAPDYSWADDSDDIFRSITSLL